MPEIRSDDGPRRLKLVYLGPKGMTLPFEWTYAQLIVCFVLGNVGAWIVFAATYWLSGFWGAVSNGVAFGLTGGVFVGVLLMRRVSHDQPVIYLLKTYWALVTRQGTRSPDRPQTFTVDPPVITDLTTTLKDTPTDETANTPQGDEDDDTDDFEEVVARARRAAV